MLQEESIRLQKNRPAPEMVTGMSLSAIIELLGLPVKYLSVACYEMAMFDCGGTYLVCTCSNQTCKQARYSETCSI